MCIIGKGKDPARYLNSQPISTGLKIKRLTATPSVKMCSDDLAYGTVVINNFAHFINYLYTFFSYCFTVWIIICTFVYKCILPRGRETDIQTRRGRNVEGLPEQKLDYAILKIDFTLPCVCSLIYQKWRQNVVTTKKCNTNRLASVSLMFLPHFDVFCDLLLNRRTSTWNIPTLYCNKETRMLIISLCIWLFLS